MSRLRGHHLICLNFFRGEGYSPEFIENIGNILNHSQIHVVFGADDVCAMCPHLKDDTCLYSEDSEEHVTELDQMAYRLLEIHPGEVTEWKSLKEKLPFVMKIWKNFVCRDCDWKNVCEGNEDWKRY